MKKVKLNVPWEQTANWAATALAYAVSTIMMAYGMGTAINYGAQLGGAVTIPPQLAWVIGLVLAGLIQWFETEWVLYPLRRNKNDTALVVFLLVFDAGAVFVGLNGHLNLVWMVQNSGDTAGLIMHTVALMGQVAGAIIGSFGAERLLQKAIAGHHTTYPNRADIAARDHGLAGLGHGG